MSDISYTVQLFTEKRSAILLISAVVENPFFRVIRSTFPLLALATPLPTIAEAGPLPGYELETWEGMVAPAGTPQAIVERLNTAINRIVRDPQFAKEKLYPVGLQPLGGTPQRFREVMASDIATYARIAKAANIRPE